MFFSDLAKNAFLQARVQAG